MSHSYSVSKQELIIAMFKISLDTSQWDDSCNAALRHHSFFHKCRTMTHFPLSILKYGKIKLDTYTLCLSNQSYQTLYKLLNTTLLRCAINYIFKKIIINVCYLLSSIKPGLQKILAIILCSSCLNPTEVNMIYAGQQCLAVHPLT